MILDKIIEHKRQEVADRKRLEPIARLERSPYFATPALSLRKYLQRPDKSGIIAEFKRQSPSKGPIQPYADVERITIGYMQAGAAALSVLTDTPFFGGSNKDLETARHFNFCPILRKDFIIDSYQVIEAKAIGADAILLIASCLSREQIQQLARLATDLSMEVLLELHDVSEVGKICPEVQLIGVNNRNLQDFSVDLAQSEQLAKQLPSDRVWVSESGIRSSADLVRLREAGYQGFLIGTHFMKQPDPPRACRRMVDEVQGQKVDTSIGAYPSIH
jgi:indole-3-glycerol phosphate synthase